MKRVQVVLPLLLSLSFLLLFCTTQAQECEVCTDVLTDVMRRAEKASSESGESSISQETIRKSLESLCEEVSGEDDKKEKLCFFIGAHKQSATSIINEVTRPLSFPKPPAKVCAELKNKDSQICDLKYDKPIDWDNLDLDKMRVKQLKELLLKLKDSCKGCVEKADYISRIKELKPKSAEPRQEL